MGEQKNIWILPAAIVVAALVIVAGLSYTMLNQQKGGENIVVQLPGYLGKGTSSRSEGSLLAPADGTISFASADDGSSKRLVSVSGTVTKTASPDQAQIYFSIQTLDKSASKSQSDNAVITARVIDALKQQGIAESDIKTSSYNLSEEFQWNEPLRKSEPVGYRTTNTIEVTVKDLSKTGSVIDAAVQAGANSVSSVSFSLSEPKLSELKVAALQDAAGNAKSKAQSIASGLGISIGQVFSASESSNYVYPVYKSYAMEAVAGSADSAPTPIIAGDITFTATVSVQFGIQ